LFFFSTHACHAFPTLAFFLILVESGGWLYFSSGISGLLVNVIMHV
jgi:hypothetical protein